MPGGQVEEGEDLLSGVVREVAEETGVDVRVQWLVGVYSKLSPPPMILHLFECSYLGGEAAPHEEAVPEGIVGNADERT